MSQKNYVLEALFNDRYDDATDVLDRPLITLEEVANSIRALAADGTITLSPNNPANFIKDYLRSPQRNALWPMRIRSAGYTARQTTGVGQCFQFVRLAEGEEPFPDDFLPDGSEPTFLIQTLSLPLTTREIVRVDEQSVAQIVVKLHVLEHFLASSPKAVGWGLREVTHLQNNVKLRSAEIDALYQAVIKSNDAIHHGAVAVEVKIGDPIIAEQIEKQALAALDDPAFEFCIPVILKRFKKGELIAIHLDPVRRSDIDGEGRVALSGIAFAAKYVFSPELPKI
ncbi:hypothetical protein [Brevundimonas sp. NIBR11]|uniref:hypothetical protein n=1 Tax=Brevundimonas sp. NIBR11 TaxID=3015999 RepID=UPI0022F14329|nr:hypothetical protein [Brevundimonas sp. NIBR11]WGM32575.1 hypothetical protein KKHFBJBL_02829 [Brevundimonas sp. NIBR11]